jgi:NAD(P)H-hydrate epimerase
VVVDGMLGTGIAGKPRPAYEAAIRCVTELRIPILALDVPSGLDADTGATPGLAVPATWTVSFITAKRGAYTAQGPDLCGELFLRDLAVPEAAYACAEPACEVLDLESLKDALPLRRATSHKGSFGRCLLIGGEHGMGGAVILAAEAALRTGLGLLAVATREMHVAPLLARRPECMAHAVGHRNELEPLLQWADALIVGPGLGREPWGQQMLHAALAADKPLLLDADALNLLAAAAPQPLPAGCVLTPHPGEAARLLDRSVAEVQADRFAAASGLAQTFGATVVLKGRGTIVATGDQLALCGAGNAGMASGGTGDVLSGVTGGLLAQGLSGRDAAALGTVLHARAGDRAALALGQRAMLATDLVPEIGELLR